MDLDGYHQYWNYAEKKGYSGTAVFTKQKPLKVTYGFEDGKREPEGRIITCEFADFYLVNVYVPNSKRDLSRIGERLEWEDTIREYLLGLDLHKPVVLCGDLNVAHTEIDLKNDKSNKGNSGFTEEERGKMTALLKSGFVDSFRHVHPEKDDVYSWWSYMSNVRARNIGWRIDYFIVSERLSPSINGAEIHSQILGSDHCPVYLELKEYIKEV
ncbi:exodeoxyribonuclease III [Bacillus sp. KH172YL63]|nr:exodeoxyribonuclease III [Bacillus sp. KH172YL63]